MKRRRQLNHPLRCAKNNLQLKRGRLFWLKVLLVKRFTVYLIAFFVALISAAWETRAQAMPRPFPCDGQLYQIATSNSTLKALNFVQIGNGYSTNFTDINSAGANLNSGWGYNTDDNLIYGVRSNSRDLWRIDFDGNFDLMATLDNTFELGSFVGDILPDGIMIYRSRSNARLWQIIDISDPANPINKGTITLTESASGADFAYNAIDGMIYGIHGANDRLFYVDINGLLDGGGTATPVFFGPATYPGSYGAMWFDEDGRLYIYNNRNNEIQVVNVGVAGNGTGNATFLAVSTDEEGGTNDGAYCRGPAPVPLGGLSGTVYEDIDSNDTRGLAEPGVGPGVTVSVYFDNGTQADLSDDILIGSTETLADGTYSFDGLVTIETYRVEVDESDPDLPQNANLGTTNPHIGVVVDSNAITTGLDFGFDPGLADLEITKTANVDIALPGETVIWSISVTNRGNGSPANVMVSDLIPSGFTYVSDSAPSVGDYYDPINGNWFVDEILVGATETLTIVTTANEGGERTNYAEIIYSSLPDPDSDFTVGRLVPDGTDDDEAQYTVAEFDGQTLSGRVFLDNGGGGATAYDAALGGAESGGALAAIVLTDATGTQIAAPPVGSDGRWVAALPLGFSGAVTVTAVPQSSHLLVSEANPGLPGLTNISQTDGTYTFTVVSEASYSGLDFGVIAHPVLTQDQTAGIVAGQVVDLLHRYDATATATVSFSFGEFVSNPAGAFTSILFSDAACDGSPDAVLTGPLSVEAGQAVCVIVRTQASSGIAAGAAHAYALTAFTDFTGTGLQSTLRNDDALNDASGGDLKLAKLVTNVTAGTPEALSNTGQSGDVLEYRLVLSNPSAVAVSDVRVSDQTPAWTALSTSVPSPVEVASGVLCSVVTPAGGGGMGYVGPLEWSCLGPFPSGAEGSVSFRVMIQ